MMPVSGTTKGYAGGMPRVSESPDQYRPGAVQPWTPPPTTPSLAQPSPSPPWDPSKPMAMGMPPLPANYVSTNPPPVPGISNVGGVNVLSGPAPGTPASMSPWSFQVPQSFGQTTKPQAPMPQMSMPTGGTGGMPSIPGLSANYSQLTDPTPYNRAVDRGNQFIGSIPNNASPLTSFSPAFKRLSPNLSSALNGQWQNYGQGMRDEAGLEFARKAGSEVPAFQLAQNLGLRGLQNDWSDLDNLFYGNNIARTTGGLNNMLQLLGAVGSFF